VERLPDFVHRTSGAQSIWIEPLMAETELLSLLTNPDELLDQAACEIIKDQRKIKIGRLAVTLNERQTTLYIKRYNAFSWRYRIGSLFMRSASLAALRGAAILTESDIAVAPPLAAVELRRCGCLEESFFVSEEIAGGITVDDYWRKQLVPIPGREGYRHRRHFLSALARLLSRLHRRKIYHNDFKDANIVVSASSPGDEKFFLLDVEGVRRCWYVSGRRRLKNLVQLNRTLGKLLTQADKLFFLKAYLGSAPVDSRITRRWVRRVVSATEKADQRSFRKAARRTADKRG
jgi:serine/threonine protein kinase